MKKKWFPLVLGLFLTVPFSQSLAQDTISKDMKKDLEELMVLMGVTDMANQIMVQMIEQLKPLTPNAPESFWPKFLEKVDSKSFVDMLIPIYAKHYTHSDIKELITFYQSPIGKKVTANLPAITQESMTVGQQWGMNLGQQVMEELQKEGN